MSAEQRVKDLGLVLPPPPKPAGNYVPFRRAGNILYLSGVGPRHADGTSTTRSTAPSGATRTTQPPP